jgi:hypothetical protein
MYGFSSESGDVWYKPGQLKIQPPPPLEGWWKP